MNLIFGPNVFTLPFLHSKNNNTTKKGAQINEELVLDENRNNIIKPFFINSRSLYNKNINPLTLKEKSFHSKFHKKGKCDLNFSMLESPKKIRNNFDYVKNHNEGYQNKLNEDFFKHYYRMMLRNLFYLLKKEKNLHSDKEIEFLINKNVKVSKNVKKYIVSKTEKEILFFDEIFKLWEKNYEFRNQKTASFPVIYANEEKNEEIMRKEKLFNDLKEIKLDYEEKFEERVLKEDQFISSVIKCLKKYGVEIINLEQYELLKNIIKNRSNLLFELKKEPTKFKNASSNMKTNLANNHSSDLAKRHEKKSFSYHEKTNTSTFPEIKTPFIQKLNFLKESENSIEALQGDINILFNQKKIEEEENNIFDEILGLKADIIKKNLSIIRKLSTLEKGDNVTRQRDKENHADKENPTSKILKRLTLEEINELSLLELDPFSNEFEILFLKNSSQDYFTKLITKFLKIEKIEEFDIISEYINSTEIEFKKLNPSQLLYENNYQKQNTINLDLESKTLQMENVEEMIMNQLQHKKSYFQKTLPTPNPKFITIIKKQPIILNDQAIEISSELQIQAEEPLTPEKQPLSPLNEENNIKITISESPFESQIPFDEKLPKEDNSLNTSHPPIILQKEKSTKRLEPSAFLESNPPTAPYKRKDKQNISTIIKLTTLKNLDLLESLPKNNSLHVGVKKMVSSRNLIQPKIIIKEEKDVPPKNAKISKKKNIKKILEKLHGLLISEDSNSVSEPQRTKIVDYLKKIALILTKTRKSISANATDEILQIINSLPYVDRLSILEKTEALVGNLLASAQINDNQEKPLENYDFYDLDGELDSVLKELENEANSTNSLEIKSTRSNAQKESNTSNNFLNVLGPNQLNRGGSQRFLRKKEKEKSLIKEEGANRIEKEFLKLEKKIELGKIEKNDDADRRDNEEREKEKVEEQRIREEEVKQNRIKYLQRKDEIRNFYQKLTEKIELNTFEGGDCDEELTRFMEETNIKFLESAEMLENYKPNMKFSNQIINPFVSLVRRQFEEEDDDDSDIEFFKQTHKKYRNSELYLLELLRKKEFQRQYDLILAFKRFLNNIHSVVKQGKVDANQKVRMKNMNNLKTKENKNEIKPKKEEISEVNQKVEEDKKELPVIKSNKEKFISKSVDSKKKRLDEFFLESRKKCRSRLVVRIC